MDQAGMEAMDTLEINDHSLKSWTTYADQIGFVPDPMILRAGEIFLNGRKGSLALQRDEYDVWTALQENIGGITDFFDIVVTRESIPLINYGDTFDRMTTPTPIDELLSGRVRPVEIEHHVYNTIKKGALVNMAALDIASLARFANALGELDAFRYDWKPILDVPDGDPGLDAARSKLANLAGPMLTVAQFLLSGLIFSGFAQASGTTHYIQPKRARFYLGLTAAPDQVQTLSSQEETAIFDAAEARLKGSKADVRRTEALPPVLPYLLAQDPEPRSVSELLDRAVAFRESKRGVAYRNLVNSIRADGIRARRGEDLDNHERNKALQLLAPYSKLDPEKSRSLEIALSSELVGVPGVGTSLKIGVPIWLRIWWNDKVPFGGLRKTLRRMWMAADGYNDLSAKLRTAWAKS
jgi:hypothetical protein